MVSFRGEDRRCVVARAGEAAEALRLAAAGEVDAVVLMAPPEVSTVDVEGVGVPVLLLFGTEDLVSPPSLGHAWKRALKTCYQMFVYGSLDDRVDAVEALIADFFARRDNFLVRIVDDRMHN